MRKFTERDGFRVNDTYTMEGPARDQLQRTKKGNLRTSSGVVTYSAIDRMHMELDVQDLLKILREQEPHVQQGRLWSVKKLEKAYHSRCRKHASWQRQGVSFKVYLALFPKTFDLFGAGQDFVRLASKTRLSAVDNSEDVMISLARACEQGFIERTDPLDGTMKQQQEPSGALPLLANVRTKTVIRSTSDPGLCSHTLPAIRANQRALDASFRLPELSRAGTLPPYMFAERDRGESAEGVASVASTMR